MTEFFLNIVNMSISASWIVLAVLLLRVFLKKAPKWITVLLWGIVAVRLICPFSIESALSLIPSTETISPEIMMERTPSVNSGVPILNSVVNPIIEKTFAPDPITSANPLQILIPVLAIAWIVGCAIMLLYTAVSYFRLKRKIGTAVLLRNNIYQSESVVSPFVLGIIKPKIYLSFNINEQDMEHVIAHEQAHIRRKDHWWKPLGFLLLTLHWFNPLMWLGYVLLCRDIELACDEKVIKELNTEQKADYSQALLTCSVNRRTIAACPLAFGEVGVKKRVKSVLQYKKPAFWIVSVAVLASIVAAICFLTSPKTTLDDELSVFLDMQVADHHSDYKYSHSIDYENFIAVNCKILEVDRSRENTIVYFWAMYHEYSCKDGVVTLEKKAHVPTVICAKKTDKHGHYELVEYWEPHEGELFESDVKAKFPLHLHTKALDSNRYYEEQNEFCENAAKEAFQTNITTTKKLQWTYQPMMSYTGHCFASFLLNLDYTHVEAACTQGNLYSLDDQGQPHSTKMRFENGKLIYWSPMETTPEQLPKEAEITLEVYQENTLLHQCVIVIERISHNTASAQFELFLKKPNGLDMVFFQGSTAMIQPVSDSNPATETDFITIDALKAAYPQFFDVSTDGGLTVYVWQMAKENWRCYLANTSMEAISDNSFAFHVGATIEQMRAILTTYDIDRKDITVQAVVNPLSSYYYVIDKAYQDRIRELFWDDAYTLTSYDEKSLPKLTVLCQNAVAQASAGTCSWTSDAGNGMMQTINGDSHHPLERIDDLLPRALKVDRSKDATPTMALNFNVVPDNVKVNAWFIGENGKTKSFDAEVDDLHIKLNAGKETCVYEIIATWNKSEKYNGTVSYSFCVA